MSSKDKSHEYEDFLSEITEALTQHVGELNPDEIKTPPFARAFLDPARIVREWPDIQDRVIEEPR